MLDERLVFDTIPEQFDNTNHENTIGFNDAFLLHLYQKLRLAVCTVINSAIKSAKAVGFRFDKCC